MTITTTPPPLDLGSAHGGRTIDLAWLTWRQHRTAIVASIALIAALTAYILYVAARITAINQQCGNTICPDNSPQYPALHATFGLLQIASYLAIALRFLPLLIGVFLGVPLLTREHEQRTLILAWSQDITPQRWLWTKLALFAGLTAALTAAAAAAGDHLAHVLVIASNKTLFGEVLFPITGVYPTMALSVVWLIVGVAVGAATRRTLPAAFAALAGYIALYVLVQWRYPIFRTPVTATMPVSAGLQRGVGGDLNDLRVNMDATGLVDAAGHPLAPDAVEAMCPSISSPVEASNQCLAQHHLYSSFEYQPSSRIPEFHLILTGGYLTIGIIALTAIWWLVRRTSLTAG